MLVALTEQGKYFVCSQELSREDLKLQRINRKFYCLQCREKVQLKVGEIRTPHFAHIAKNKCEQMFTEGESERHLQGKLQLYKMFQHLKLQVELEPYLKELAQRPDLLVYDQQGRRFAIEFQCSPISLERLRERTNGYLSSQITPIWLFHTPLKKINNRFHVQRKTISPTLQQMIRGNDELGRYIITYDPQHEQFIYFSNLLHVQDNSFIMKLLYLPNYLQRFPFYEPVSLQIEYYPHFANLYLQYRTHFCQERVLRNRKGINDSFLRGCYEMRLSLQSLPQFIGIPVLNSHALQMFTVEWQVLLWHYCAQKGFDIKELNAYEAELFLKAIHLPVKTRAVEAILAYSSYLRSGVVPNNTWASIIVNQLQ